MQPQQASLSPVTLVRWNLPNSKVRFPCFCVLLLRLRRDSRDRLRAVWLVEPNPQQRANGLKLAHCEYGESARVYGTHGVYNNTNPLAMLKGTDWTTILVTYLDGRRVVESLTGEGCCRCLRLSRQSSAYFIYAGWLVGALHSDFHKKWV